MALFDSYRAVGLITSGRMTSIRRLGDAKNFVTCPAGRAFYVYDCEKLHVSLVSRQVPCAEDITCVVASGGDVTFVAAGKRLYIFKRAECLGEFKSENTERGDTAHDFNIEFLCSFGGGDVLLSLDISGRLRTWSCHALKEQDLPECDLGSNFRPKFLLHPKTYLNKVLLGGEAGLLQLWNFRSGKLVHAFKGFTSVPIECAEQSPAVDVVALGLGDGSILLHNLRFDRTLFGLKHVSKARVTSLSFFSDARDESVALLASGTKYGEICVWDLKQKSIVHTVPAAHLGGGILALHFVPGEFTLMSNGADNSLKSWQLDSTTYHLRRLKSREGHFRPPTKIRFHPQGSTIATLSSGSDGRALQLISAGADRSLRTFHCVLDNHAKELSQKCEQNRLPAITSLATSEARENDWFNVVTTHVGEYNARVWRFENGTLGEGLLNMRTKGYGTTNMSKRKRGGNDSDYYSNATTCMISNCGNFAFIGSASGIVSKYNLQSGRFLSTFPKQIWDVVDNQSTEEQQLNARKRKKMAAPGSVFATTGEARPGSNSRARDEFERHGGMISGVCLDGLDEFLFTVGYDSRLKVWDSETQELVETIDMGGSPATMLERSRDGGLFAIALENFTVNLFDSLTRKIVRQFKSCHSAKITDLCFTPNSRWLLTSSLDTTMRVWDLATSRCVDWMRFSSAVTSMTFSPSNEYLATSHVDCLAICLWANRVHFGSAKADKVIKEPVDVDLPCFTRSGDEEDEESDHAQTGKKTSAADLLEIENDEMLMKTKVKQTSDVLGTVTLSEASSTSSRWFTLWHLELIKERNRPIQPPEKPQQVPFFLPALAQDLDSAPAVKSSDIEAQESNRTKSRILPSASSGAFDLRVGGIGSVLSQQLEELVAKATLQSPWANRDDKDNDDDADDEVERIRLRAVKRASTFRPFVEHLSQMSASAVDFELRSLSLGPEDEEGGRVLLAWLQWIFVELEARTNFELIQSILGRMVKIHGEAFQHRQELRRVLSKVLTEQKVAWKALQGMMQKCLCYVESFSQLNGI